MAKEYGDGSIKTLDPVTHIRLRPGMYVGEPGTGAMYHDCIYILMKEVIDNAIDEFGQGFGKRIDVNVNYDTGEVSVRDYGRGIPLGKVVDCVSQMNTGGKYDNENYQLASAKGSSPRRTSRRAGSSTRSAARTRKGSTPARSSATSPTSRSSSASRCARSTSSGE